MVVLVNWKEVRASVFVCACVRASECIVVNGGDVVSSLFWWVAPPERAERAAGA